MAEKKVEKVELEQEQQAENAENMEDLKMEDLKDEETVETPSADDLLAQIQAKEKENEELFNRLQRLQADFDNFKKRSRKELEDMARYGAERLILSILPSMDNFSLALAAAEKGGDAAKFMSGMDMIYRQLMEALEKEGLKTIETLGQPFDPEKHEAVMQVEAENQEQDNQIVEELKVGYTLYEKVIRPSVVKVAKY
ncbi:nucleotide exchange factor GrpE [Bacillota bacterium LX-D]|nr:nucleotide exchange factor GrpE [Bacillota bacterium LX-D]